MSDLFNAGSSLPGPSYSFGNRSSKSSCKGRMVLSGYICPPALFFRFDPFAFRVAHSPPSTTDCSPCYCYSRQQVTRCRCLRYQLRPYHRHAGHWKLLTRRRYALRRYPGSGGMGLCDERDDSEQCVSQRSTYFLSSLPFFFFGWLTLYPAELDRRQRRHLCIWRDSGLSLARSVFPHSPLLLCFPLFTCTLLSLQFQEY